MRGEWTMGNRYIYKKFVDLKAQEKLKKDTTREREGGEREKETRKNRKRMTRVVREYAKRNNKL